ncbi:putative septum formation initiator protein [Liberibacter crescens BT-1]|uniref:Putative septum formation initiator protein n=1 Tax=Liberibacter crescens (strain BT-1) TaxID=1215343 RepID=L0EVW6_LIBCB|nr:septum formation initiator family protein [Liberibacter crescens]AGA65092.1 putative septum formation initiator protein [Liberibacter crescens BT-1]AMC13076.1 cell division protein [Liberibacter crescens]
MWTKHHKKNILFRLIFQTIAIAFIIYFGNHAIVGSYGLKATEALENRRVNYEYQLETLKNFRMKLERKVELMRDGSLEKDMLDEKARYNLNLSRSDEIVIFYSYF